MLDAGTGNKQWKERGIGNIKILQHKEHQRCRVLMRQEKTMKLLVNHLLLPGLVLVAHNTSDRAFVWRANDFSDGEIKETDFCIRFADSDIANTFKENFEKYKEEMRVLTEGADTPGEDGGAAADEAAEALGALSTADKSDE
jgi:Ran-binding protein 1